MVFFDNIRPRAGMFKDGGSNARILILPPPKTTPGIMNLKKEPFLDKLDWQKREEAAFEELNKTVKRFLHLFHDHGWRDSVLYSIDENRKAIHTLYREASPAPAYFSIGEPSSKPQSRPTITSIVPALQAFLEENYILREYGPPYKVMIEKQTLEKYGKPGGAIWKGIDDMEAAALKLDNLLENRPRQSHRNGEEHAASGSKDVKKDSQIKRHK